MKTGAPIFAIGSLDLAQAAQRPDGQWFMRKRDLRGFWGKWDTCPRRPDAAWYNPQLGRARLPQMEQQHAN